MNEQKDIELYTRLQRLTSISQRINQLSWTFDQTKKRYPAPNMMTTQEMEALVRSYLALGYDIEIIYQDWKKEIKEYEK